MIKNIFVAKYTNSGFTQDDYVIKFDFSDVKFFTTLFSM